MIPCDVMGPVRQSDSAHVRIGTGGLVRRNSQVGETGLVVRAQARWAKAVHSKGIQDGWMNHGNSHATAQNSKTSARQWFGLGLVVSHRTEQQIRGSRGPRVYSTFLMSSES